MDEFKKIDRKINLMAGIVIVLSGFVMLYLWFLNPEFRTLYVGEPFVDANQYIPGMNFNKLGFWKLHFTADYALGPEKYHPFYQAHNPPLSEIINAVYQKFGLVDIKQQRLICILWTLAGYSFFYAILRILVSPLIALCSLIIALSNPFVIYWGDNLFSSHQWMFMFASLYFLILFIRKKYFSLFFIAWAAFFCAGFSNYEVIPFMAFFALGLRWFKLEPLTVRALFAYLSAPIISFCLRGLLIIWAVGFKFWYSDLIEVFLHRSFGIKTRLIEIYKYVPIIMWDVEANLPKNFLWLLYNRLENLFGYGWSFFLLMLFFPNIRCHLLQARNNQRLFNCILLFFIMSAIWYGVFPQHTFAHFHSFPMLLFIPFSSLLWAAILIGIWQNIKHKIIRIICCTAILCPITIARIHNFVLPKPFPGIAALRNYEGKTFCTNAIPTLVSYYTKTPTAFCGYETQLRDLRKGEYYFFLSGPKAELPRPEFFFCAYKWNESWFKLYFPLVERGENYAIFRLQMENFFVEKEQSGKSEKLINKSEELNQKDEDYYIKLGVLYREQGKYAQSIEALKTAITLNPKNEIGYVELGYAYKNMQEYINAEEAFKKAMSLNPKNDEACKEAAFLSKYQYIKKQYFKRKNELTNRL